MTEDDRKALAEIVYEAAGQSLGGGEYSYETAARFDHAVATAIIAAGWTPPTGPTEPAYPAPLGEHEHATWCDITPCGCGART